MRFSDILKPKDDPVQIRLIRKGEPVAGLYKDAKTEVRSPALDEVKDLHVSKPSNRS